MSRFTTEIRWICENNEDFTPGYNNINRAIAAGRTRIFDFDYPLFDQNYKETLETKIIRHFYTREIGYETVGLWKLKLCDKLNLIMPYYNQLYESCLIEFDPLIDVDYRRDGNRTDRKTNVENENNNESITGSESHVGNESSVGNRNENKVNNEDLERTEKNSNIKSGNKSGNISENDNELNNNYKLTNNIKNENRDKKYDGSDVGTNAENSFENNSGVKHVNNVKNKQGEDDKWDLYSDTPQSGVQGIANFGTGSGSVGGNAYLTNARRNTDEYEDEEVSNGSEQSIENGQRNISGNTNITYDYDTVENNNITDVNNENEVKNKTGNKTKEAQERSSDISSGNNYRNDNKTGNEVVTGSDNKVKKSDINIGSNKDKQSVRNATGVSNGNQDYFETIIGKRGNYSYSKMLDEFRKTFLNIDLMIINELEDLFMGLWE